MRQFLTLHFPVLLQEFLGNTLLQWSAGLIVLLTVAGGLFLLRGWIWRLHQRFEKGSHAGLFSKAAGVLGNTSILFIYAVALYAALGVLSFPPGFERKIGALILLICVFQVARWLSAYSVHIVKSLFTLNGVHDPGSRTTEGVLIFLARLCIWLAALLMLLDNLGVDITALVAGLGIGGIAVALAVQNVLGDVLSSLSIVLDKPFEVGDFIIVGDFLGVVERIGVKTTRVRSLSGEQLVFANSDLLNSRIRNFKRMQERRVAFTVGATYQTPRDTVERLPALLKGIFDSLDQVRFDRAHFKGFGPSSLDFEIVYYVLSQDYNVYMDTQQIINLEIMKVFENESVEFAYPTQTVFVEQNQALQAKMEARLSESSGEPAVTKAGE